MTEKIKLGVIYGGRSGEHEVSLMSARSVLSVINPEKYDIIEIGITRQGQWFVGQDLWVKLQHENYTGLTPAIFPASPKKNLEFTFKRTVNSNFILLWMWFSRSCMAPTAKMAPCKGCWN